MLALSRMRIRLASSTARRRSCCATFTTTAATAFSLRPTTTRLQWQKSPGSSRPGFTITGSSAWQRRAEEKQHVKLKTKKAAKKEFYEKEAEKEEAEAKDDHVPRIEYKPGWARPKKKKRQKEQPWGRKNLPGPVLAAMKLERKEAAMTPERKTAATDEHGAHEELHTPLLSPSDVERVKNAAIAEVQARKDLKKMQRANTRPQKPKMSLFGPFEDVIQPIALTLWGGKVNGLQKPPKLIYTMQFLGATCLWRVQIRSTHPKSENDLWRTLWNGTRPGGASPTEAERLAWIQKARKKRQAEREKRRAERENWSQLQKAQESDAKESDAKESDAKESDAKESDGPDTPPHLEAVVQDLFKRQLARLAHEKAPQQRALEARRREEAQREQARIMRREKNEDPQKKDEDPHKKDEDPHKKDEDPQMKDEDLPTSAPLTYTYINRTKRLPYIFRDVMRHIDICGPVPSHVGGDREKMNYIWTHDSGNVLANTFEMEKIALTTLHDGVSVRVWRSDFEMREMEAFMSPGLRTRLESIKEQEKKVKNKALGRKGLQHKSKFVLRNERERLKQLLKKGDIIRNDGGWRKILEIARRDSLTQGGSGFALPPSTPSGQILFTDVMPHPDRAVIDAPWERRLTALRNADALADYNAFLRERMQAGILPELPTPEAFASGEILRGWMNKRDKAMYAYAERLERLAWERGEGYTEDAADADAKTFFGQPFRRIRIETSSDRDPPQHTNSASTWRNEKPTRDGHTAMRRKETWDLPGERDEE